MTFAFIDSKYEDARSFQGESSPVRQLNYNRCKQTKTQRFSQMIEGKEFSQMMKREIQGFSQMADVSQQGQEEIRGDDEG